MKCWSPRGTLKVLLKLERGRLEPVVWRRIGWQHDGEADHPQLEQSVHPSPRKSAGVMLYAHDLLQNPFRYEHQLVELDTMSIPWISGGNLIKVQRFATEDRKVLGIYAVRFSKMLSKNEALYDVLSWDVGTPMNTEGSLVVLIPPGLDGNLDRERHWMIEPMGTVEGTNGFGAELSVPIVRFWNYVKQEDLSAPKSAAEVEKLMQEANNGSVDARIRLGLAYAIGDVVPKAFVNRQNGSAWQEQRATKDWPTFTPTVYRAALSRNRHRSGQGHVA